jgi:hypothetical protein
MLLRVVSDPQFRPYHAQGVDMGRMTPKIASSFECFVSKMISDQNRHRPWVLKDPRMLLFTKNWLEQVLATHIMSCAH